MDRAVLVTDLKKLFRELSENHGPVGLLMLLAPDSVSEEDWNLIVSARGFDESSRGEAIREVFDIVSRNFTEENWRKILRVTVLRTDDPFVTAMNESLTADQSVLHLHAANVSGVEIPKAIVLQSKAAA